MAQKVPPLLQEKVDSTILESLERGLAVRWLDVVLPALVLAALLAVLAVLAAVFGIPDGFVVAVTVAAASLCVIWAMMSVSASLNAQFDALATLIVHYAESGGGRPQPGAG